MPDQPESPSEQQAHKRLHEERARTGMVIARVGQAYHEPWKGNPSTSERAVLGHWLVRSVRHLAAIGELCRMKDLSMVASVHWRQIFELHLQVRYFLSFPQHARERLAQKIAVWGCADLLQKLEPARGHAEIEGGYIHVGEQYASYADDIRHEVEQERKDRNLYWFGRSLGELARQVSRGSEDLRKAYQLISADAHGVWALAIEVANPEPGVLDFRGYPDKATMYRWASDLLAEATRTYLATWNEIAEAVDAPAVSA